MVQLAISLLRVLQTALAVANLALAASVYQNYLSNEHVASPGALAFLIFAPVVSILSIIYLELSRARAVPSHQLICLGLEALNAIFYFAGFIAYALFLTYLSTCEGAACTMARAAAVIAAAEFSTWITSTVIAVKDWFESESTKGAVLDAQMQHA
ncbi:hypothetical protein VHEMI01748 [[Torrubiella] hemipterigena]|uniref:MARVEL domain-containing protein n=1 Tax=[Torrubiella] hemipterigena TaxID=1531966 RepID=A0A0A1T8I1_9HYPO|nr:hypothetical protein VHEMI01748 [[Torrubiella] hemipterigena]